MFGRRSADKAPVEMHLVMVAIGVEGTLSKDDVLKLSRAVIPELLKLARKTRCFEFQVIANSVLAVFDPAKLADATAFALDVRDYFVKERWKRKKGLSPLDDQEKPFVRVAVHTGPVWIDKGRRLMQSLVYGQGVTRAQRITELAAPNEVFMSREARAVFGEPANVKASVIFHSIPGARLAGDHYKQDLFWVGRGTQEWERACLNAAKEGEASSVLKPQVSHIRSFEKTDEMVDFIRSDITNGRRKVRTVRYALFNGGATLSRILEAVRPHLADDFRIEILVWDSKSANLGAHSPETETLRGEIERLSRFLSAHDVYSSEHQYSCFTELACEYLMLGSRILNVPARHPYHINQIPGMIQSVMDGAVASKKGTVVVRKAPFYMPGRITLIDDLAFFSLYLHKGLVGPILLAPQHSMLFERLNGHFSEVWDQASGTVFPLPSRSALQQAPAPQGAQIFLSYRRANGMWAAGRLYDRLIGEFSREAVFMDVGSLAAARDFREQIERQLDGCEILLALMGPGWAEVTDKSGAKRLDHPDDLVKFEIATALKRGIPVLPVLLDDAAMPDEAALPDSLKPLARRHAEHLRFHRFGDDTRRMVALLKGHVRA